MRLGWAAGVPQRDASRWREMTVVMRMGSTVGSWYDTLLTDNRGSNAAIDASMGGEPKVGNSLILVGLLPTNRKRQAVLLSRLAAPRRLP